MNKIAIVLAALIIVSTILIIYQDEKAKTEIKSQENKEGAVNQQNPDNSEDRKTVQTLTKSENAKAESQGQITQTQEENTNEEEREYTNPACNLVRPGNIQYVECTANYVAAEKVSLTISNDLGETINAKLRLNNCGAEKQEIIENNQEKEFIFYCQTEDYFEEDIYITYEIQENNIEVFGVVLGTVS